ncbi:MAG: sporulation protein YjcZ [bacterium]|nr:sporulation protein YjcZ [bacterium]
MSCSNNQPVTTSCGCSRSRNSFVIIIVLYILLAIILGSVCTW